MIRLFLIVSLLNEISGPTERGSVDCSARTGSESDRAAARFLGRIACSCAGSWRASESGPHWRTVYWRRADETPRDGARHLRPSESRRLFQGSWTRCSTSSRRASAAGSTNSTYASPGPPRAGEPGPPGPIQIGNEFGFGPGDSVAALPAPPPPPPPACARSTLELLVILESPPRPPPAAPPAPMTTL